jgi:hypothetical protein
MRDWNAEVAQKLKNLGLPPQEREEVIAELADYLQDRYEQALADGISESEAVQRCLAEVAELRRKSQRIRRAKRKEGAMNHRTKTLWVPGLVALTAASTLLFALQRIVLLQPKIVWKDGGALVFYPAWWLLLPLCGAAGAYLSRRAGGRRLACLVAGLFPALVMLAVFCFILPISVFVDRNAWVLNHLTYFALAIVNHTVVPALGLLIGAAPICGTSAHNAARIDPQAQR